MDCGSGMTSFRRLREWQQAGVWQRLHQLLLARLREADQIAWEQASLDSAAVPAKKAARKWDRTQPIAARWGRNIT